MGHDGLHAKEMLLVNRCSNPVVDPQRNLSPQQEDFSDVDSCVSGVDFRPCLL